MQNSGASSTTVHGSLRYIADRRPPFGLLENVYKKPAMLLIVKMLRNSYVGCLW
jgi:hypothetical protein